MYTEILEICYVCWKSLNNSLVFYPSLNQDLKLKYYRLMIELCQHQQDYLATCQHYRAILETPRVQADEAMWKDVSHMSLNCNNK